jgi:hypothetical protein
LFLRRVSAARQQLQQRVILLLRNHTRIEQALELRFIQTAADFRHFGLFGAVVIRFAFRLFRQLLGIILFAFRLLRRVLFEIFALYVSSSITPSSSSFLVSTRLGISFGAFWSSGFCCMPFFFLFFIWLCCVCGRPLFVLFVVPPSAFAAAQAIVMQSRVQTATFIFVFIFVSSLSSGFILFLFGSRSLERCKNSTRRLNQV